MPLPGELIAKAENWIKNRASLTADGTYCMPWEECASKFCIVGAMHAVFSSRAVLRLNVEHYEVYREILCSVLGERGFNAGNLDNFNDHPKTTHEIISSAAAEADTRFRKRFPSCVPAT